jgi:hypothetical protein
MGYSRNQEWCIIRATSEIKIILTCAKKCHHWHTFLPAGSKVQLFLNMNVLAVVALHYDLLTSLRSVKPESHGYRRRLLIAISLRQLLSKTSDIVTVSSGMYSNKWAWAFLRPIEYCNYNSTRNLLTARLLTLTWL